MRRAFLCHSSDDKDYARNLAGKLSRARVIFDDLAFTPGQDFRDTIRQRLSETGVFVFLASASSIASSWCRFELDEAELRKMDGGIQEQLTVILDRSVGVEDLPAWLRKSRVVMGRSPSQAARDVQQALLRALPIDLRRPLVGREEALSRFARQLVAGDMEVPHVLVARGLAGVGRRSFLERAVSDNLDLLLGPRLEVTPGMGEEDLFLFLLDEMTVTKTPEDAAAELMAFRGLGDVGKTEQLVDMLTAVCDSRSVPCFIDDGGLLDENGAYGNAWLGVIELFLKRGGDRYLAMVHRRRPQIADDVAGQFLDNRINPLDDVSTRLLLTQLVRRARLPVTEAQILELSRFVDGYPPAAASAVVLCERHSAELLLANPRELVEFKARAFIGFLNGLHLADDELLALQYLSSEQSGLSLAALSTTLDVEEDALAKTLSSLMDLSLVQLWNGTYIAAGPVRDAVFRLYGWLSADFYGQVAERLAAAYWESVDVMPPLAVVDATLHAALMSGRRQPDQVSPLIRHSTLHRAAVDNYYSGDYRLSLEYVRRARDMGEAHRELRETEFKSLVRLEEWEKADEVLSTIEAAGDRKFYFLKGFGLRRQGDLAGALESFRSAVSTGDRSVSVFREMAFCQYGLLNFSAALGSCKEALEQDPNNLFVLDLRASIDLALRDYPAAEQDLQELERVDVTKRFIHHRRAAYYASTNQFELALLESDRAIATGWAKFEAYGQRISILIESREYVRAAEALRELADRYPGERQDIITGLQCKSLVRQGQWREARNVWERLREKQRPVHQGLLRAILTAKSQDRSLTLVERQAAEAQAAVLPGTTEIIDLSTLDPTFDQNMPA